MWLIRQLLLQRSIPCARSRRFRMKSQLWRVFPPEQLSIAVFDYGVMISTAHGQG